VIHRIRGFILPTLILLTLVLAASSSAWPFAKWLALASLALVGLGIYDRTQKASSILRSYPVLGHLRFLLEDIGPELRQYIVEHNTEGRPFDRDTRSLVYQRSKGVQDMKAFGTEQDVYAEGYSWISHSIAPRPAHPDAGQTMRVQLGGADCGRPYSASVFNISAMSFGSLSPNAITALSCGAKLGGFAHNTGEGSVSRYHRDGGGDLIWQVGTGYFGCRAPDGGFDPERFRETASDTCVKAIEIKLSQGAKPGHGGILPAAKITKEIAAARGIPMGEDCLSPSHHRAFSTPIGLVEFVAQLRELSGGKPIGIKLAVGDPREWLSVCHAMVESGIVPDFISVDGGEGGTGAAPIEFSDHIGMPLKEAIVLVHQSLVGAGLRDRTRLIASGKLVTGFEMASACALGADAINSARGFMLALGCIQAQKCHTNSCPVGVATQDARLGASLVVTNKAERVRQFHCETVHAFAEVIGAAGLDHPSQLQMHHLYRRVSPWEIRPLSALYPSLEPGALLRSSGHGFIRSFWDDSRSDTFNGH
jgi:glutamate synthase domain-containing protein 2